MSMDLGVLVPVAAILSWPLTVAAKSLGRRPAGPATADVERLEARLVRIEQAVDAIAVEVERVAEGQRFTAAVLADRGASPAPELAAGGAAAQ
jgi:hypothetical protein